MPRSARIIRLVAVSAVVALANACASTAPTPGAATPPTSPNAIHGTASSACDPSAWRAAPVTVTHDPTVPPVPVASAIRTGAHPECRYDRIVFDITGAVPGYQAEYAQSVTTDPADRPVTVPGGGTVFLRVVLHPAQGHTDAGAPTITTRTAAVGYSMLKGYVVTGDYEGHLTVVLGLARSALIRVGELPGRVYLDVSY
ncbi:MAG TPA: hypothetical protein VKB69_07900 [Micromonosporaceae bacterium]|nr:hypothetical protein [Micromonosporaceae bacterium]